MAQFVVTEDADSDTGEIAALKISPAIRSEGPYQNVTALPIDGAAVTLFGHASNYAGVVAPQNLVYHKAAFAFGCADFELPTEGVKAAFSRITFEARRY